MECNIVFKNEYISIKRCEDKYYIESYKNGMSLDEFNILMGNLKMIKITSFAEVKNALLFPPKERKLFGIQKPRIEIEITADQLQAYLTLNVDDKELEPVNRAALTKEIIAGLLELEIKYGIKNEIFSSSLVNYSKILVAEGKPAINGEDAVITMYEISDPKPELVEDGKADFYEMNLIHRVVEGEWLGDRVDPTLGIEGKTVKGEVIKAIDGKKHPLQYDKNTVREEYKDGVTTLYARNPGAAVYKGDKISVSNFLEIHGNVSFNTGNVDFDGFLTVKGTIEDNFSVSAVEDIEILGEFGVGCIKEILSSNGNIYIRGGIAGKNKAVIKSKKDIYTKFISDATIICEGSVYVGFYCMNSNIIAKEVIVESTKGRIVGGNVQAAIRIEAAEFGTRSETRTILKIEGFERNALEREMVSITEHLDSLKDQLNKVKQLISIYTASENQKNESQAILEKVNEKYSYLKDSMKEFEYKRKKIKDYLKTPGEGAVIVKRKCHPKVRIEIKDDAVEVKQEIVCDAFCYKNNEIITL